MYSSAKMCFESGFLCNHARSAAENGTIQTKAAGHSTSQPVRGPSLLHATAAAGSGNPSSKGMEDIRNILPGFYYPCSDLTQPNEDFMMGFVDGRAHHACSCVDHELQIPNNLAKCCAGSFISDNKYGD